jgi:hypothetical protein
VYPVQLQLEFPPQAQSANNKNNAAPRELDMGRLLAEMNARWRIRDKMRAACHRFSIFAPVSLGSVK